MLKEDYINELDKLEQEYKIKIFELKKQFALSIFIRQIVYNTQSFKF